MQNIIPIVALVFIIWYMNRIKKLNLKDELLSRNEKIIVMVSEIFSPLVGGAIYYFGWRNFYPKKAVQAKNYSVIIFIISFLLALSIVFLTSKSKPA